MGTFKAIRIDKSEAGTQAAFADFDDADLMDGDVTVRVTHSTVNYKDGLAVTGKSPVVRRFPMIPGIDFAGIVEASTHLGWKPGDEVILNGWGLGETHLGGYAQKARVKGDWLVPLPQGLTRAQAMAIGTAGYTAMLSVLALELHGLTPAMGPAIVTGAAGGVGSIAVALLARAGWRVIASTGRPQEADWLKALGAADVIDRSELSAPGRPLGKERWAAGVDSVGSHTLHLARRVAAGHRQRHVPQAPPHGRLGAARQRSGCGQAREPHHHGPLRGGAGQRPLHSGGQDPGSGRGGDRLRAGNYGSPSGVFPLQELEP